MTQVLPNSELPSTEDFAQANPLVMTPSDIELPPAIGPYKPTAILGRGGMGVVFRGISSTGNPVAIKALIPAGFSNPTVRERFYREADCLRQVRDEHVCGYLDHGEFYWPGRGVMPFLVMELVEGINLARYMTANGPLSLLDLMCVARDAATGLAAIHKCGLIHRDLKPGNIVWQPDRKRAVLIDLGLARCQNDHERLTSAGLIMGTPSFMSPEQVRGQPLDHRSDLFSLGILLFTLAAGRNPFETDTPFETQQRVLYSTVPALASVRPDLSPRLTAMVDAMLAREPSKRPQSAASIVEMLNRRGAVSKRAKPSVKRVVIAGHDAISLVAISGQVGRWGYKADTATNCQELMDLLAEQRPFALILDLHLSDTDSTQLVTDILRLHPKLPILILTGHATIERAVAAVKAGCQNFLTKPPNPKDLRQFLEQIVID